MNQRITLTLILILAAGCSTLPLRSTTGKVPQSPAQLTSAAAPHQDPAEKREVAAPSGPLTLAELAALALENNPSTRSAWFQARASEAALGSERSAYLPEIDLNAQLARSGQPSGGSTASQTTYGPSLALSYLLFDFGGREARVAQARQTLISAVFLHDTAVQNLLLRLTQSYYDLLDAKALLAAQEATVRELQTAVDSAEARHRAGVATIADVLQARTALSEGELNRESIEGLAASLQGTVASLAGLPVTTDIDLGALPPDIPLQQIESDVERLLAQAAQQRPDLLSARAQATRAEERIREVRAQGLPSIGLSANGGRLHYGSIDDFANNWSTSVLLRFPLFTGFRNTFDLREARELASAAHEQVRAVAQQVDVQVWSSYHSLRTAGLRVRTSRELLASAQQSRDVAQGRYREGVGGILEVLNAQAALERARAQEIQSRADWFVALAQLAHDVGDLTPAEVIDVTKGK